MIPSDIILLDMALKAQGIDVNPKTLTRIISTYSLINEKGDKTCLKDVLELEKEKK